MDPGHVLFPIPGCSTESPADQRQDRVEDTSSVRTQDHCRPELDLSRTRNDRLVEGSLPGGSDLDAEAPRFWYLRLSSSEDPRVLVIRRIVSMRVDGRRAGLQPRRGWSSGPGDCLSDDPGRS